MINGELNWQLLVQVSVLIGLAQKVKAQHLFMGRNQDNLRRMEFRLVELWGGHPKGRESVEQMWGERKQKIWKLIMPGHKNSLANFHHWIALWKWHDLDLLDVLRTSHAAEAFSASSFTEKFWSTETHKWATINICPSLPGNTSSFT